MACEKINCDIFRLYLEGIDFFSKIPKWYQYFLHIFLFFLVYSQMYAMPKKRHPQSQQVAKRPRTHTHSTKRMFRVVARIWPSSTKLFARILE